METPLIQEKAKNDATGKSSKQDGVLEFQTVGIWTIMRQVKPHSWLFPGRYLLEEGKKWMEVLPIVYRFVQECFSVAPGMMIVYLVSNFWSSTESAIGLYLSSQILNIMQNAISSRKMDGYTLFRAVFVRIIFTFLSSVSSRLKKQTMSTLSNRVRYLFDERLLQANLRLDLPTHENPDTEENINKFIARTSQGGAWNLFNSLSRKLQISASIVSQVSILLGILNHQHGGLWFGLIYLIKGLFDIFDFQSIWESTAYVWDSNPHYRRMRSLMQMIKQTAHRVEIITDVLSDYIHQEWLRARKLLGDISDEYPNQLLDYERPLLRIFSSNISEDIPLVFYAIQIYINPKSFSLPSVALMQQASSTLTWTVYEIFRDENSLLQICHKIKALYAVEKTENKLQDGSLNYFGTIPEARGMDVIFKNVSFSYPKSTTGIQVIKNVSFNVKKGQTVVIVGSNGSGKSTLLKLFNRLYDPTSGEIHVDGHPLQDFVAADVRRSMAMLYQTYSHYPLSIQENIALGQPELASLLHDERKTEKIIERQKELTEKLAEAAKLGGSFELIQEQKQGFETVLHPTVWSWSTRSNDTSQAFKDKMAEVNNKADVSAGQWQRLALSRLFFRTASDRVRLVAADEPSASLDPQMEYELFERLRNLSTSHGKTLIYVTHRFGYLTKHADIILVMHKGELIEQGKHEDLLVKGGEYAKLYKLQAEAFMSDDKVE
ncbi:hypothetical protein M422DRAFT_33682 [Sphaerobolus stellatus SS14]|uniref:ABC transporter domain-containing protein n=1 Tax=Sphaerobolus stellatus (strain SS14) TaxID=990650 RepID=A0A0C9URY3_SPHS4|nr:hypothetical protein M422DRAFT_33682 [Sphaerobolus stellatus SS14]